MAQILGQTKPMYQLRITYENPDYIVGHEKWGLEEPLLQHTLTLNPAPEVGADALRQKQAAQQYVLMVFSGQVPLQPVNDYIISPRLVRTVEIMNYVPTAATLPVPAADDAGSEVVPA